MIYVCNVKCKFKDITCHDETAQLIVISYYNNHHNLVLPIAEYCRIIDG